MARGETNGDKSQHTARRCVALSDIWRRQRTSEETSAWKKKKLVAREVQAAFAAFNMKQIKQATAKAFWGMKPRDSSSVEYRAGSQRILLGAQICVDVRARTFELRLRLVVLRLMLMPLMLTPSHFLIREVFFRTCEAGATYLEARGQKGITISLCFVFISLRRSALALFVRCFACDGVANRRSTLFTLLP